MRKNKIKTIDIRAKEWFDRINGNSYFSAIVTVNYQLPSEQSIKILFQYGYDDHYIQSACEHLIKKGLINTDEYIPLWRYCQENNIILRKSIQRGCKKRDIINFVN